MLLIHEWTSQSFYNYMHVSNCSWNHTLLHSVLTTILLYFHSFFIAGYLYTSKSKQHGMYSYAVVRLKHVCAVCVSNVAGFEYVTKWHVKHQCRDSENAKLPTMGGGKCEGEQLNYALHEVCFSFCEANLVPCLIIMLSNTICKNIQELCVPHCPFCIEK